MSIENCIFLTASGSDGPRSLPSNIWLGSTQRETNTTPISQVNHTRKISIYIGMVHWVLLFVHWNLVIMYPVWNNKSHPNLDNFVVVSFQGYKKLAEGLRSAMRNKQGNGQVNGGEKPGRYANMSGSAAGLGLETVGGLGHSAHTGLVSSMAGVSEYTSSYLAQTVNVRPYAIALYPFCAQVSNKFRFKNLNKEQ